jgi:very-short-patch-repair endonuclease
MQERARVLRQRATPFEQRFWDAVRGRQFAGFKFRRQRVMGPYIVDFVCLEARVVVELDGDPHRDAVEADQIRDDWLRSRGFRVLRVWNAQWDREPQAVLHTLWQLLQTPPSGSPLPTGERGWG